MAINFKPLRKPEHLILNDREFQAQRETRQAASEMLLRQPKAPRFEGLGPNKSILDTFARDASFLSMRNFGEYVCGLIKTKIVSDEHGRIADILLTVPPHSDSEGNVVDPSDERHLRTLIRLMKSADSNRHFTMLCSPNQVAQVRRWFTDLQLDDKNSISISTFKYTVWAQDAYVAVTDDAGRSILCEGVHFPRRDDATIADDVAAQTSISALQSYLYFQGGNVLEVGDYVLIGKDYIQANLGRAHLETEDKILAAFKKVFGKNIISLGRSEPIQEDHRKYLGGGHYQPIFHIDMYVTPTGKIGKDGKPVVFVASPKLGRQAVGEKSKPTDYDIYFDEAADQLSGVADVRRLPILPSFIRFRSKDGADGRYYFLSYNNAIVENYGRSSNVYLPTFSQDVDTYRKDRNVTHYEGEAAKRQALDRAAKAAWEKLQFTVYQMDGLEDLAIGWGCVHCITKTVARETPVA
jgi:hypothetical protein